MGHIEIESPFDRAEELGPTVLTLGKLHDIHWRLNIRDVCAYEEIKPLVRKLLMRVPFMVEGGWGMYTYSMARWTFSDDVDVDRVGVRFVLPDGQLYEVPPVPEGCPRVPVKVRMIEG